MFSENLKKIAVVSSHFNEEEIYKILPKTKYEIVYLVIIIKIYSIIKNALFPIVSC